MTSLDVTVRLAAISRWYKRPNSAAGLEIPHDLDARRYELLDLRQLYADARLVVPLELTDLEAAIATIVEAMSMEKASLGPRTDGQHRHAGRGETVVDVPPGNAAALRDATSDLLAKPVARAEAVRRAHRWACEHADVARCAAELAAVVDGFARIAPASVTS